MQRFRVVSLALWLGIATSAIAGDLRITCPPGLDVFVDDEFAGVSTAPEDGKYLTGIDDGYHVIRIEKEGFSPMWFAANVGPRTQEITLEALSPKPESGKRAPNRVGSVRVSTSSENSTVKFGGLMTALGENPVIFGNVFVGVHDIWFERYGIVLHEKIVVQADETTEVMGNFLDNRIEIQTEGPEEDSAPPPTLMAGAKTTSDCFHYWIQVAQTSDPERIKEFQTQLEEKEIPKYHQRVLLHEDGSAVPLYKLRVGPMKDRPTATLMNRKIKRAGFRNTWIVREECAQ